MEPRQILRTLILLTILHYNAAKSQKLENSRYNSYYTYVYGLTNAQAEQIYKTKNAQKYLQTFLTAPLDSFCTDSALKAPELYKKKGFSHYAIVKAQTNRLDYTLTSALSFGAYLFNDYKRLLLTVYDKQTQEVLSTATVKCGGKTLKYDAATKAYIIPLKKKEALLSIQLNEEQDFVYLSGADRVISPLWVLRKLWSGIRYHQPQRKNPPYSGYLVFNKPKYLPHDTVKLKAYILNKKGKPLKEPLNLVFYKEYDYEQHNLLQQLNPASDGAYVYQFVLSDSLKINQSYMLGLTRLNKHESIVSNSFHLEDYQLDETFYEIEPDNHYYNYGEPIVLRASGKDASGLNLMDARIELEIVEAGIDKVYSNRTFIPSTIWKHKQALDAQGTTTIVIPDSVMPPAKLAMRANVTFLNSNNESHTTSFAFTYDGERQNLKSALKGADVEATYYRNGKPMSASCILKKEYRDNRTKTGRISLPFKERLDQQVQNYIFDNDTVKEFLYVEEESSLVELRTYRTHDSVFARLVNPRELTVVYSIYKGEKELEKGLAKNLNWRYRETSDADIYVHYHYLWAGSKMDERRSIPLFEKNLQVNILQPRSIYPGEKTEITVQVTDIKNKPVKDVNITALALSGQFNNSNIPEIPYLGKARTPGTPLTERTLERSQVFLRDNMSLNENWITRMRLDSIPYYRMLFPKNGMHINYDSIPDTNAQVSPFLFKDGVRQAVYMIWIDNKLVYYFNTHNASQYVFVTEPGYHSIKIRGYRTVYELDSVFLRAGIKTDLALDVSHLPPKVKTTAAEPELSDPERAMLRQSIFMFYSNVKHPTYVWQNTQVCLLPPQGYSRNTMYHLCGFFPDSLNYAVQNEFVQKLMFEPDYLYSVKKSLVKMQSYEPFHNKVTLPYYTDHYRMGMRALSGADIRLNGPAPERKPKFTRYTDYTKPENGTYRCEYSGDNPVLYTVLSQTGSDSILRLVNYSGKNEFHDLEPGYYTLEIISTGNRSMKLDSIPVKAGGTLFQRLFDKDFKNQQPKDTLSSGVYRKEPGSIKVTVEDRSSNEVISYAVVIVYQNGVQVAVSTSDQSGEILFRLAPGRYDLKCVYVGYQGMELRGVLVQSGKKSTARLGLSSGGGVRLEEVNVTSSGVSTYFYNSNSRGRRAQMTPGRVEYDSVGSGDELYEIVKFAPPVIKDDAVEEVDQEMFDSSGNPYQGSLFGGSPASFGDIQESSGKKATAGPRNKFSDYAYWQPNLLTDEKGQAHFKAGFPDNLTTWKTYALAMDGNKHSGTGYTETKAKLQLAANLSLPRFLIEGDSACIVGKALNYMPDPLKIKSSFTVDGKTIPGKDTVLKNAFIQSIAVVPAKKDSATLVFGITSETNMQDAEEKSIPVYPKGSLETSGIFLALNRDTTLQLDLEAGTELYLQNDPVDFLIKELEQLQNYPHSCMEQTASKLNAYLMEENIRKSLGQKFTHAADAKKLLKRLSKGRKANGSWGWWEESPENLWMTCYVYDIVLKALAAGYSFENFAESTKFLIAALPRMKGNELLTVLNSLSGAGAVVPYSDYLKKLEKEELTLSQNLIVMKIRQANRLDYDVNFILKEKKNTLFNNYYWGNESNHWYDNSTNATLLAYTILQAKDSAHAYLPFIRSYLLEIKQQNKWKNTIETAKILETILPALVTEKGKVLPVEVVLSPLSAKPISRFPYKEQTSGKQHITLSKKGSTPVYFTAYQKTWNTTPGKKEDSFSVTSHFETGRKPADTIKAGKALELVVEVLVKKKSEYLMIEVPVPAGCSYDTGSSESNPFDSHREYFKDKTAIFCEQLPEGKHTFRIKLQPRFKGAYTLNPAKVESMYFPVFYGRNGISRVEIR